MENSQQANNEPTHELGVPQGAKPQIENALLIAPEQNDQAGRPIEKPMSIKERVERNPWVFLIVVSLATASVVVGVQGYFDKQSKDAAVNKLESQLISIDRRIEGKEGERFLDVRKFIIAKTEESRIPTTSKFLPEDNFYASPDTTTWTYSTSSESALAKLLTGQAPPPELDPLLALAPQIHLWQGGAVLPMEGSQVFKAAVPLIIVQRTPIDRFAEIVGSAAEIMGRATTSASQVDLSVQQNPQDFRKALENIYRGDIVGFLQLAQMQSIFSLPVVDPKISVELVTSQKVGNVLYAQFRITLKDVTVGGVKYERYYIRQEDIIISAPTDVYMVRTFIPSSDPASRGEVYTRFTEWFGGLAILLG